jgi:hypothetical protein
VKTDRSSLPATMEESVVFSSAATIRAGSRFAFAWPDVVVITDP